MKITISPFNSGLKIINMEWQDAKYYKDNIYQ